MDSPRLGPADVDAAIARCGSMLRRTPVLDVAPGTVGIATAVTLKLEFMQYAGSFKARGSLNSALGQELPDGGLIAASGGNHGVAVARTGHLLGVPTEIFVPEIAAPVKVARIRAQGATVHVGGALYDDAQAACDARAGQTGALNIHPYDAPLTVAGQATMGAELIDQVPDLDTVVVAIGGGGLASGLALTMPDRVKIVGVETEQCNCFAAAQAAGHPVRIGPAGVSADSLGAKAIGSLPWTLLAARCESVLVSDRHVIETRQALWDELQIAAEHGGATALAALTSGAYRPAKDERVAVVICGANTDPSDLVGP